MTKPDDVCRRTARDLLEEVGGPTHALHTVVAQVAARGKAIVITCSCRSTFKVPGTQDNVDALRNVPLGVPS